MIKRPRDAWDKTLNAYFRAFCRRTFNWSPEYRAAVDAAFVRQEKIDGKTVQIFSCAECKAEVPRREKQVDHIEPVVPVDVEPGWDFKWEWYRDRIFTRTNKGKLQVICKVCHSKKSKTENAKRAAIKKARKT